MLARRAMVPLVLLALSASLSACSKSASHPSAPGTTSTTTTAPPAPGTGVGVPSPYLGANLTDVSCAASGQCAAVGSASNPAQTNLILASSLNAGVSWRTTKTVVAQGATLSDVACTSTGCMAVGSQASTPLVVVSDRAGHYANAPSTPTNGSIQAVGCAPGGWCIAAIASIPTASVAVTTDGAGSWGAPSPLPANVSTISRISCADTSRCVAVGTSTSGGPLLVSTADGGATWSVATIPTTVTSLYGAACGATSCVAVGQAGKAGVVLDADASATSFATAPSAPGVADPTSVACTSSRCVVVGATTSGAAAAAVVGRGARSLSLRYAPNGLVSVSCLGPTRCVAASPGSLVVIIL